jgi:hypothetical protein
LPRNTRILSSKSEHQTSYHQDILEKLLDGQPSGSFSINGVPFHFTLKNQIHI